MPLCDICEENEAVFKCDDCGGDNYCSECGPEFHAGAKFKSHNMQPLNESKEEEKEPAHVQPAVPATKAPSRPATKRKPYGTALSLEEAKDKELQESFYTLVSNVSDKEALKLYLSLTDTPNFNNFSEEDLKMMMTLFTVVEVEEGDTVIFSGECASFAGVILQGEIETSRFLSEVVEVGTRGSLIGEMGYFKENKTRHETSKATQKSVVVLLPYEELDVYQESSIGFKLCHMLAASSQQKLMNSYTSKREKKKTSLAEEQEAQYLQAVSDFAVYGKGTKNDVLELQKHLGATPSDHFNALSALGLAEHVFDSKKSVKTSPSEEIYCYALALIVADGKVTTDDAKELELLRKVLDITDKTHDRLLPKVNLNTSMYKKILVGGDSELDFFDESQERRNLYRHLLAGLLLTRHCSADEFEALTELQKKLEITEQDHIESLKKLGAKAIRYLNLPKSTSSPCESFTKQFYMSQTKELEKQTSKIGKLKSRKLERLKRAMTYTVSGLKAKAHSLEVNLALQIAKVKQSEQQLAEQNESIKTMTKEVATLKTDLRKQALQYNARLATAGTRSKGGGNAEPEDPAAKAALHAVCLKQISGLRDEVKEATDKLNKTETAKKDYKQEAEATIKDLTMKLELEKGYLTELKRVYDNQENQIEILELIRKKEKKEFNDILSDMEGEFKALRTKTEKLSDNNKDLLRNERTFDEKYYGQKAVLEITEGKLKNRLVELRHFTKSTLAYEKLLKMLSCSIFLKTFVFKRTLKEMHVHLKEVILKVYEARLLSDGDENNRPIDAGELLKLRHQREVELDSFRDNMNWRALSEQLLDEVIQLKHIFFQQIEENKLQKNKINAFFHRNVDLSQEKMNILQKAVLLHNVLQTQKDDSHRTLAKALENEQKSQMGRFGKNMIVSDMNAVLASPQIPPRKHVQISTKATHSRPKSAKTQAMRSKSRPQRPQSAVMGRNAVTSEQFVKTAIRRPRMVQSAVSRAEKNDQKVQGQKICVPFNDGMVIGKYMSRDEVMSKNYDVPPTLPTHHSHNKHKKVRPSSARPVKTSHKNSKESFISSKLKDYLQQNYMNATQNENT